MDEQIIKLNKIICEYFIMLIYICDHLQGDNILQEK